MRPIMFGSRMARTHPSAVKKLERPGWGFGGRSPSPSLLVVQDCDPVGCSVFWFVLGNPYRQLLRVDIVPCPLSVAPVP